MKNSRQPIAVEARKARAVRLLNSGARPLENVEDLLKRARVDLVELKRTGSREGLPELVADLTKLRSEIERLEELAGT
jgi:DNA-binding ferritin-like protein